MKYFLITSAIIVALVGFVILAPFVWAAVAVTPATGGTNISADKAANATSPAYTTLGNIVITEVNNNDINSNGTFTVAPPTGWTFNTTGVTTSVTGGLTVTVTSQTASLLTLTIANRNNGQRQSFTIIGLQVRATNGASLPSSGNITRAGGTASVNGITNGVTNLGSLSQTFGAKNKLAFTTQPSATANVSTDFTVKPVVTVQDQFGNTVTNDTSSITRTAVLATQVCGGTAGSGTLTSTPTSPFNATAGVLTYTAMQYSVAESIKICATATGATSALSNTIIVSKASQAPLTAIATPSTVAYGSTATLSSSGGSGTGAVTFSVGASTGCSVLGTTLSVIDVAGSCSVTATKAADATYLATTSPAITVTLTPKSITVTASSTTKEFGAPDPVFTYTSSDPAVSFTGTLSRVEGESAGTYAITIGSLSAGANYTITFVSANLTINQALNPVPSISSLSPTHVDAGSGQFILTVTGLNFIASSTVNWNSSARVTSYPSSTVLTATILASDILSAGTSTVTVTNPAPGGGVSNASAFVVAVPPPVATKFVILPPGNGNVDDPLTVTVQAQDNSGNIVTTYQNDVTLNTSGSATGGGLVNIVNGQGTRLISDHVMESVTLSLTDSQSTGLNVSSTQIISFVAGATKTLTVTGNTSFTAGERNQLTVTRRDQYGNLVTVGSETFYLYSQSTGPNSKFYDASSGGNVVSTVLISADNSSASIWYYDETAGSDTAIISDNVSEPDGSAGVTDASLVMTVVPASVAGFYLNNPGDLVAGNRLGYTVRREDQFGNFVTTGSTTVYLYHDSTDANSAFYDSASGGNIVTAVNFAEGASTQDFWFFARKASNINVTASDNSSVPDGVAGVNDMSDSLAVSAGPTSLYQLNNPGDMSVGTRLTYMIERFDAYVNPTREGDSTVYLYVSGLVGTSTLFYDSASEGNIITSLVIPAGSLFANFWFGSNDPGYFEVTASDNPSAPDGTVGIYDSLDGVTVSALPVVATRFIIIDPTDAVVGDTVTVTVKAVDGAGLIDATYQNDVTLNTSGSATPGGVVDIINGVGTISLIDTKAETVNLSLTDTGGSSLDVSSTQNVVFAPGPVAKFALSDNGNTTAGTLSSYTVSRFDQYDNPVTTGATNFYLYSNATAGTYAFYDAGSGGSQIQSGTILNNSGTATFWFEANKVGSWMVSVSDNATAPDGGDGLVDGVDSLDITAGPVARLTLNDPGDMQAGTRLGYTATRYDAYNNLVTTGGANYYLSSNANSTTSLFYLSANGGVPVTNLSFSEGQSTADFWYSESKLGLWTVYLSDNSNAPDGATGVVDGEDAVTVSVVPIVATKFIIVNPADVMVGTPVEVTVRAVDDDENIDTTYQTDVTLVASGSATGEGLVNIINGVGQITINNTKAETVELSLSDTQHTNLDVSDTQEVTFSITAPLPSGGSGGGGVNISTPRISFSGRAFPGAKLTILAVQDGQVPITKQVTGSASGNFTIKFNDDLPSDINTFAVKAVDKNSQISQTKIYKLNSYERLIQQILLSPTVELKRGIVTQGTSLGVIGSAMPNYKVEAYVDGKSVLSGSADSSGHYEILPNTYQLAVGEHGVKVRQIGTDGVASDYSIEKKFRVVTTFVPRADLNDDGLVNVQDWSIFMAKWNSADPKGREDLDMNGDSKVDVQDFGAFMKAFNRK